MRIAFYCGENLVRWDPSNLYSGIGGSEEAAIHMAIELARLGCDVSVYGDPHADAPRVHDGVRWVPHAAFRAEPPGDVFVAWRMVDFVDLANGWPQVYHWLHNRQETPYSTAAASRVDRVLLVSRHHGTDPGFAALDQTKIFYTSNGLSAEFLRPPGNNEPDRAIYASCPARGLLSVLEMWPRIRRAVPTAKLDVYHGFDPVYEAMATWYSELRNLKGRILARLEQPGVTYYGMVGQDLLADAFARSGVWVYPTECPETSCITAMKALAMGCLPVTSGFAALTETLDGRDLGPVHQTRPITKSQWRMYAFRCRAVHALRQGGRPSMMTKRRAWSAWARERYAWPAIARQWLALFHDVARQKSGSPRGVAHAASGAGARA
jgi:glycosyltransferase involved in cell wall biosynthesis